MKTSKFIMGCALAVGLMAIAADQAQASLVTNNVLYSPFNIKVAAQYESGGLIKTMRITSKDILMELGYTNVTLAVSDETKIWVVNKKNLVRNLSIADTNSPVFDLNQDNQVYSEVKDDHETEAGTLSVAFNSDQAPFDTFNISGVYFFKGDATKENPTTHIYSYTTSMQAKALSGSGTFSGFGNNLPVTGSLSFSGGGKLIDD